MNSYIFDITDNDDIEYSVIACYYRITDGYACFWDENFLLCSFYKPKKVIRNEKT